MAAPPASQKASNPEGYGAPFLMPVFVALTASALWLNENPLHCFGVPHVIVLVAMAMLLCVHETLRPFCCNFWEVCVLLAHATWVVTRVVAQYVLRGCKPTFPEWTIKYELFLALQQRSGEFGGANVVKPLNAASFRATFDILGDLQRWTSSRVYGVTAEFFQHNGLEHIWIKPQNSESDPKQPQPKRVVVLYYHGGAYLFGSPRFYAKFGMRLRDHVTKAVEKARDENTAVPVQVDVLLANYRKIPEHRYPAPVDDALTMFDYLVNEEKMPLSQIVVVGDSAGGGLAMSVLLRLRNAKRAMPAAALVICPWVNMLADHKPAEHCFLSANMLNSVRDHCIAAAAASSSDQRNPEASLQESVSMNADLTGLPPLLILAGDADLLYSQSLGLAETAKRHGVDVELDVHEHMPHAFCLLPESVLSGPEAGLANLAAFAAKNLVSSARLG